MFYKILDGLNSPVSTVLPKMGLSVPVYTYKLNEINVSKSFNEIEQHDNGLYFADEQNILNFLGYGNMIYEVVLPDDARIVEIYDACKEYKADKIIIKNPQEITPELVQKFLENGATICNEKIIGVLNDLTKNKQEEILNVILNTIDENDPNIAYEILNSDATYYYRSIVEKYEKTTNPEVISVIQNNYNYNKLYKNNDSLLEKLILSKISKNLQKPIRQILDEYYKSLENVTNER